MLRELLKELPYDLNEIATKVNISPSALSKYVNNITEVTFINAFNIIQSLFPDREIELMVDYCSNTLRPENLRLSLEYFSLHYKLQNLEALIRSELNSHNQTNREWAQVYQLVYLRQTGAKTSKELLKEIRFTRVKDYSMMIMLRLLEAYCLYDDNKFAVMAEISEGLEDEIRDIDNSFIRSAYTIRLSQIFSNMYLYAHDKPLLARQYAQKIIHSFANDKYKASAYMTIGYSFLFENQMLCYEYLIKSKDLYQIIGDQNLVKVLDRALILAKCYWEEAEESFWDSCDHEDLAYLEYSLGNLENAKRLLQYIEEHNGFTKYYQGIILGENKYLYESLLLFKAQGDRFFANFPRLELLKRGEDPIIVQAAFY